LRIAQTAFPRLHALTFQRNVAARGFYQARGIVPVREMDGSDKEEQEPDVLYLWSRA
jgi:hypothetical protein